MSKILLIKALDIFDRAVFSRVDPKRILCGI